MQRFKVTPTKMSNILMGFGLLLSMISLFIAITSSNESIKLAKEASNIALTANQIATETKNISNDGLYFEKESRSLSIVQDAYEEIYNKEPNREVILRMKSADKVNNKDDLLKIVDIIEGLGNAFCQGSAWKWHINTIMKKTIIYVCENKDVLEQFANKKNGTALLCYEFSPESSFAKTLKFDNINSCQFHDSSSFQQYNK